MRLKVHHFNASNTDGIYRPVTTVRNIDTGEPLEGVASVTFEHIANGNPRLILELWGQFEVEVECDKPTIVSTKESENLPF